MTFTDGGKKVKQDWMPLAAANGTEWMRHRFGFGDQFNNLYRRKLSLNWALWYIGAIAEHARLRYRNFVLRKTHRVWNRVISRILCRAYSDNLINSYQLHELTAKFDPTQKHDCY